MKATLSKALSIFGSTKDLVSVIITPPKSEYGLDEFSKLAYFVARCSLLVGGITGMGFSYVISYPICKAIFSPVLAQVAALVTMFVFFLLFDGLLSVAYPLWLKLQASGRISFFNRKQEGTNMLFVGGVLILMLWISLAIATISFSLNSSEFPVAMAMAVEVEKQDPKDNSANAKEVLVFAASFDKEIETAKKQDEIALNEIKAAAHNHIKATKKRYRNRSQRTYNRYVAKAQRDSVNRVEGYESKYQQALRNKNHAVNKMQQSVAAAQRFKVNHDKALKEIFDKKATTSIYVLKMLGILGTIIFLLITAIIIILDAALSHANKYKQAQKIGTIGNQSVTSSRTNTGTKVEQTGTNKGRTGTDHWNPRTDKKQLEQENTPKKEQKYAIPSTGEALTFSEIRRSAFRQAAKWRLANEGKGGNLANIWQRWREYITVMAQINQPEAVDVARECQEKHGIQL